MVPVWKSNYELQPRIESGLSEGPSPQATHAWASLNQATSGILKLMWEKSGGSVLSSRFYGNYEWRTASGVEVRGGCGMGIWESTLGCRITPSPLLGPRGWTNTENQTYTRSYNRC